ncbi:MAG: DUF4446 family protein [Anaerotignum sp.]|nr:DUF4446 family protein [Anaerotignum sp.]
MTWIENNMAYLVIGLAVAVVILFVLCIVLFAKFNGQKKKYDYFMGANRRPSHNLEMKIQDYYETSKRIEEKYSKLLDMVTDMDKTDKTKIQKIGLIRYNPFDEMGGNLCFALALLDGYDNGVVLNGIHSRTGSFTYAKPIEMGVSTYMLSEEEIKAVEMAKNQAYEPEHEKVVKVRFKPTFKRKDKDSAMEEQITLDQVEMVEVDEAEERRTAPRTSIGDVTQAEKELILQEETLAGKIAAAELILQQREEAKKSVEKVEESVENTERTLEEEICEEEPIFMEPVFMERPEEDETEEK